MDLSKLLVSVFRIAIIVWTIDAILLVINNVNIKSILDSSIILLMILGVILAINGLILIKNKKGYGIIVFGSNNPIKGIKAKFFGVKQLIYAGYCFLFALIILIFL